MSAPRLSAPSWRSSRRVIRAWTNWRPRTARCRTPHAPPCAAIQTSTRRRRIGVSRSGLQRHGGVRNVVASTAPALPRDLRLAAHRVGQRHPLPARAGGRHRRAARHGAPVAGCCAALGVSHRVWPVESRLARARDPRARNASGRKDRFRRDPAVTAQFMSAVSGGSPGWGAGPSQGSAAR